MRSVRVALWVTAIAALAVASAYAIGGRELVQRIARGGRTLRSQAVTVLQPPAQTATPQPTVDTTSMAARIEIGTPVSLAFVLAWVGGILVVAVVMFYVTGRRPPKSRRA